MKNLLTDIKVGFIEEKNKKELAVYILAVASMAAWFTITMANGYFSGECELARDTIRTFLS